MAKKSSSENITKIKKAIEDKKLVIGTERVLKELKKGKITEVFVTNNCPIELQEELKRYSTIGKITFNKIELNNEELGVVCKKPFSISIAGIVNQ